MIFIKRFAHSALGWRGEQVSHNNHSYFNVFHLLNTSRLVMSFHGGRRSGFDQLTYPKNDILPFKIWLGEEYLYCIREQLC